MSPCTRSLRVYASFECGDKLAGGVDWHTKGANLIALFSALEPTSAAWVHGRSVIENNIDRSAKLGERRSAVQTHGWPWLPKGRRKLPWHPLLCLLWRLPSPKAESHLNHLNCDTGSGRSVKRRINRNRYSADAQSGAVGRCSDRGAQLCPVWIRTG